MLKPVPMSRPKLLATLEDILKTVRADDSFEGSIEYLMPTEGDPDCAFMVRASYRVGNSMGQGGVRMIGDMVNQPPTMPPLDLLCKLGSIARHVEEATADGGSHFDVAALQALIGDKQVLKWMSQMDKMALLSVRR